MRRREPSKWVAGHDRLADIGVDPVTPEEAEKCDYVCAKPVSELEGGVLPEGCSETPCVACGVPVVVDPRDPVSPPRICLGCALTMSMEESN